ncbi:translation initiation factor IF-2 [Bacilliculturomica massiliensis]|nr:translation initiation factor IF-2 [Bacilliculturomica massiliensis]
MSMKVKDLARELKVSDNDLLDRIKGMGISAESGASVLEDIDVVAVRNTVLNSKKRSETKIVKVAAKKTEKKEEGEVKVTIKPAARSVIEAQEKAHAPKSQSQHAAARDADRPYRTPPQGKPMPKTVMAPNGKILPQGRPMPKNAVPQTKPVQDEETSAINETAAHTAAPQAPEQENARPQAAPAELKETAAAAAVRTAETPAAEKAAPAAAQAAERPEKPESEATVKRETETANGDGKTPAGQTAQAVQSNAGVQRNDQTPRRDSGYAPQGQNQSSAPRRDGAQSGGPRRDGAQSGGPRRDGAQSSGPRRDGAQSGGPRRDGAQNGGPRRDGAQSSGPRRDGAQSSGPRRDGAQNGGPRRDGAQNGGPRRDGAQSSGPRRDGAQSGGPRRDGGQYSGPRKDGAQKKDFSKPAPVVDGISKPTSHKKQNEKKDRDKRDKQYSRPMDLSKAAPKKHRKNREKVDQVQENNIELEALPSGTKIITVPITVKGLSEQIEKTTSQIIMALMRLGIMANINQNLDEETAVLLGEELGVNIVVDKVEEEIVEEGLELFEDKESDLKPRPPIITVMGHVDHGKTSLLDAIRKTNVTDREAGGITQHIGASEVVLNGQKIVFLDTPGHEAFTAMRARGAHATDIAVLVVAADDSVKPQTVESISHAKAAGVPIIVAINKMDKPGANPDRVKQDLTEHGIVVEDWGGDTIAVPVSAKSGEGIVNLLEMILLQAEVLELKANPNRLAIGTVIEARLDKAKGPVATLLVLNGTLQAGMSVVAGTSSGRIRAMTNYKGDAIRKAGPATAVEILGLTEVPEAGDQFNAVREDKVAREIAENRKTKLREEVMKKNSSVTLEQLFSQIEEGEVKELNLIIKADVQGSVGALTTSLEKLKNENVKVRVIHSGVGAITESDVMLANTSNAIIIAFNVRPSTAVTTMADREGVEIRTYRIIYEAIEDIEAAMKGMLDPVFKEVVMGKLEIRTTFKVPGVGTVGGAYVLEGKVQRNAQVRLVRDGIVIHEGKISSLKRFKDDAKEVNSGYECGIGIENYNDVKEGDIVEAFKMEEIERK